MSCMQRVAAIAALALMLAVPVWAQHGGGGHGGGGGHASFGGGGHFSGGGHAGGFSHSASGASRGFSGSPYLHNGYGRSGYNAYGRNGYGYRGPYRTYGFRNNCYGYGCGRYGYGYGYPWWGYGYDPWWWNSDSDYDDQYNQNLAIANDMNQQSLEEQQMLRQEEADGDQDAYAPRNYAPRANSGGASPAVTVGESIMSPTILVFRDQHREEVRNYAIVGQTLWNFAPQHTEKIPLSDLDLAATQKANDDRGVTFRVPGMNEGQ